MVKLFSGTPLSTYASSAASDAKALKTLPVGKAQKTASGTRSARLAAKASDGGADQPPVSSLRLVAIQQLAKGGRWRVEAMRAYSEPVLLWFTRGQGRITIGGVTRGYGSHNAIFIPPGKMHGFELTAQSSGTALFFGGDHGLELPQEPMHLRIRDVRPQAELSAIIENIQREYESDRPGKNRAARHHLGLLSVWLEREAETFADEQPRQDAARRLARAYADLLEKDFRNGKTIAEFAKDLGVTPTHLTRVCNKTCGRSASDLLHDRLIFEARKLLAETRTPVQEVAEILGFRSPAYFTRAFQQRTGKTPTAFRKLL